MAEIKERKEIADQFHWDLTVLFKNDAEWENAFAAVDEKCAKASSFSGTLNSVEGILAFLEPLYLYQPVYEPAQAGL